jgi:hypothetical protein
MSRHWEECDRDERPNRWSRLYVTMNPKGDISMTKFALDLLDTPEALHLFFDKINQTIGLKPTRLVMKNAFPIGKRGKRGGCVVRAFRLTQKFGIHLAETVRFTDPQIDADGVLNLDLRKVTRVTQGQKKKGSWNN